MAIQNLVPTEGMVDGDERRTSIRPVGKEYSQIRPAAQLSVIVAADRGGAIGLRGGMLWHLPGDLRRFKAITTGKAVVTTSLFLQLTSFETCEAAFDISSVRILSIPLS